MVASCRRLCKATECDCKQLHEHCGEPLQLNAAKVFAVLASCRGAQPTQVTVIARRAITYEASKKNVIDIFIVLHTFYAQSQAGGWPPERFGAQTHQKIEGDTVKSGRNLQQKNFECELL